MTWRGMSGAVAIAAALLATGAGPAAAAPGDLEPELGGDGTVTVDLAGRSDSATALRIQPDGKLVVGGFAQVSPTEGDMAALRLLADGTPDPGFDDDGRAFADFGTTNEGAWGITVDAQGRLLLAGSAGANSFGLARFSPAGELDSSLAGDGTRIGDFGGLGSSARAVVTYPDGAIGVIGHNRTGSDYDFAAARLLDNGDYDNGFDGDGKAVVNLGTDFDIGSDGALTADGKLLIAGVTGAPGYDCGVARLTAGGAPDAGAFGAAGFVLRDAGGTDYCDALALDSASRILLAGRTETSPQQDVFLARLNPEGAFDPSFATTGFFAGPTPDPDSLTSVAESPDGKIVAAGYLRGDISDFLVVRLNPDGTLDPTFSGDGIATASFGVDAYPGEVAVLPDGDIVVAGNTYPTDPAAADVAIARFEGGPLEVELTAKPKQRAGRLAATLFCSLPCSATARGKGRASGDKFKTRTVAGAADAGQQAALRLKLKRRVRRRVAGEKGKVEIAVAVTSGELTAADSTTVKLKR